ncbi:YciI family protein [Pseudonocardia xinjiangensis]|uniref:YciI family protein n=1 Tax=Pseudonocardia xinjiangensis TaxID=75289 RepID=UPI003D90EBE0
MKYLLIMQMNPAVWEALSPEQRDEVMNGHGAFMETIRASGEMVATHALAEPAQSVVVRGRDGVPVVTDGPFLESKEFMGGFYLVECETRERAVELAAMIPDAAVDGMAIEVREVVFSEGAR